jgi:galactokinase
MALTAEQQAELEYRVAEEEARATLEQAAENLRTQNIKDVNEAAETLRAQNNIALENLRAQNQAESNQKQAKLEAMRVAKEILVENRRTQAAADATDITSADIKALALELATFVNE